MSKVLILLLCALCSILVSGSPATTGSKVKLQVLYECMCPACMQELSKDTVPVYHQLSDYVDLHLYPYGNARTNNENGTATVQCQHGEEECYGNKIHACAIDILKTVSVYADYIACMMPEETSDGVAKQCASDMKIDAGPILECAKGERGQQLLIQIGQESKQIADYQYVPYTVLNGERMDYRKSLKTEICKLLNPPPQACSQQ